MSDNTFKNEEEVFQNLSEFSNDMEWLSENPEVLYTMHVGRWLDLYKETKNPIYAWLVIRGARWQKTAIPEEVLKYLEEVAYRITRTLPNPPGAKQTPVVLAQALGMIKKGSGQGSVFSSYKSKARGRAIAIDAYYAIQAWGEGKKDYAFAEVGEKHGTSKSTVLRHYESHLTAWQKKAATMKQKREIEYDNDNTPSLKVEGNSLDFKEAAILLQLL